MRSGGDQPIRPGFVPSWVDLATVFGWAPSLPVVQQTWSSPSLQKRRHCHSHCLHRWMVWALQMAETEKACKNITFQKMAESRHQYHQRLHTHQLQVLKTITCSNSPKTFLSRSGSSRNLPLFTIPDLPRSHSPSRNGASGGAAPVYLMGSVSKPGGDW